MVEVRRECDGSCRAQSQVTFQKGELELEFCKHHAERHHDILSDTGWYITEDTREEIK